MELGSCADRCTPLNGGNRQPDPLSIAGAPKGPQKLGRSPGGPWGAPQYNQQQQAAYEVAYDGKRRKPTATKRGPEGGPLRAPFIPASQGPCSPIENRGSVENICRLLLFVAMRV